MTMYLTLEPLYSKNRVFHEQVVLKEPVPIMNQTSPEYLMKPRFQRTCTNHEPHLSLVPHEPSYSKNLAVPIMNYI
jgi:hypothetical protein